ncbi:MAG: Leucine-tRNA ligase [Parcubacteria group bacterium GW2011_GWA2_42_11]|nr:MAG: Leucine-tRNA ligase [Parcubacteria group bacterium GW2011_GWA2_42_11]
MFMKKYDHKKIEVKWQKYWKKHPELFAADDESEAEKKSFDRLRTKKYILDMFPYPSGDGLHCGHVESYTATDIISRYWRLRGKNVLHPQGWDAFGLPAENYAIKTKIHPAITTKKAIATFKKQMGMMGFSYDWSREVNSSDPEYYKWTQWFFLLLYKNGLAYKAKAKVNWCDDCQTVLANEQAEGGVCERCGHPVRQKDLEQWFFRIADFIEDKDNTSGLLSGLDKIDWPESTKAGQRNWIGKSEGAQFKMEIVGTDKKLEVYTTRLDTVFGMTFALIAPEHTLIQQLKTQITNWPEVEKYLNEAKKKSELQRISETKEKTGVELKGMKVKNPFTHENIPVFVSDFVLGHYGTGAVMAVPAHDQRDFEFAKKYKLPIKEVIKPNKNVISSPKDEKSPANAGNDLGQAERSLASARDDKDKAYTDDGILMNSGEYIGLTSAEARKKLTQWLEKEGIGDKKTNYKMRDWLVSRQRYWGAPIPIIYCDECAKRKPKFLFLHCYGGSSKGDFWPWLKAELEKKGFEAAVPDLPGGETPKLDEQIKFVLDNYEIDEQTIIATHSLGGVLAMKLLGEGKIKARKLIMMAPPLNTDLKDNKPRPALDKYCDWQFDFKKIKKNVKEIVVLADLEDHIVPAEHTNIISRELDAVLVETIAPAPHFDCDRSEVILNSILTPDVLHPGEIPVPEKDLPVKLSDDVDFMPTGESPLKRSKKFQNVKCPVCGGRARREADTMDTFVCSSWYYYRYPSARSARSGQVAFDPELTRKWLPVDLYLGGAEHTVLHLLYSRFFTKVLHNLGYIEFDEPFAKLRHQGIILAEDGRKMSKSLGNVINPDSVVKEFGADALRMFEMFMGPLEDAKPWNTKGIVGVKRFLEKVWKISEHVSKKDYSLSGVERSEMKSKGDDSLRQAQAINSLLHKTIKKVGEDIEALKFNTAISALMILVNEMSGEEAVAKEDLEKLLIILSPFAPHMAEELWNQIGYDKSIFTEKWPEYDVNLIKDEIISLPVQINGKVRAVLSVPADISEDEAKKLTLSDDVIIKWLAGKEPKKIIFVKGRLVNIVI